jgi:hypothetical protein
MTPMNVIHAFFDLSERALKERDQAVARNKELSAEIERLTRLLDAFHDGVEVEQLRALVKALADDLEAELRGHYGPVMDYPSEKQRFERDMEHVYTARAVLEPKP